MHRIVKHSLATVGIAAGVAVAGYFLIPPFRQAVDNFASKFKAQMDVREAEIVAALSSTEEEVQAARKTWEEHQAGGGFKLGRQRHRDDSDDDDTDLIF